MGITYKELLWLLHPEKADDREQGGCAGCPHDYGFDDDSGCKSTALMEYCDTCWNREIPYPVIAKIVDTAGMSFRKPEIGNEYIVEKVDMSSSSPVFLVGGMSRSYFNAGIEYRIDKKSRLEFDKSYLKTGMVVKTRRGEKFIVIGDRIVGEQAWAEIGWLGSSESNEIMEVYAVSDSVTGLDTILHEQELGTLIWTCAKEISADEAFRVLREHYGCNVRIKE